MLLSPWCCVRQHFFRGADCVTFNKGVAMPRRIAVARPLLLAAIIALGFGTVWAVLIELGNPTWRREFFGPEEVYEYLEFRMDGTPVVENAHGEAYGVRHLQDVRRIAAVTPQEALAGGRHTLTGQSGRGACLPHRGTTDLSWARAN